MESTSRDMKYTFGREHIEDHDRLKELEERLENIEELLKDIRDYLERPRPSPYTPPTPLPPYRPWEPPYAPPQPYRWDETRCPQCGSTGGCNHITITYNGDPQ